jgi:hypothetical protein
MARSSCDKDTPDGVTSVSSVRRTARRLCRISVVMSVFALATAPNTCRPPPVASRLPTRPRGDVTLFAAADERRTPLTVITTDAVAGWSEGTVPCGPPVRNVWLRSGAGLRPASMGSRCCRTPEARCQDLVTQQDIVRAQMKWPARIVRMMRPALGRWPCEHDGGNDAPIGYHEGHGQGPCTQREGGG